MDEIANQLVWKGLELDRTAQEETHARLVLSWFKGQVRSVPNLWLVLDGLDVSTVTPAALVLIKGIAAAAELGTAGDFKVVLIALSEPLPDDVEPYVLRDTVTHVDVPHLREFFKSVARDYGHTIDDAGTDVLLTELLGAGPHQAPFRLTEVGPQAVRLATRVFAPAGGGGG